MFAFLVLLFVVLTVYHFTAKKEEGFESKGAVVVPEEKIPSRVSSLPEKEPPQKQKKQESSPSDAVQPSQPPGTLPTAPYEQLATMSPLPYQDTTQLKANRQQLVNLLEMLKGFLAFEAQSIAESSDPAIQLPLTTARSDFHTLQSEVSVLNRNPGIQPTITLTHLTDISANLAYLQSKVRLLGSAGALQGPAYPFGEPHPSTPSKEGFQDASAVPATPATLEQLKSFMASVQAEILRLSASGTTDPVIQARVAALTSMKQDVADTVTKLESGALLPTEVPIQKKDIDQAFPVLGKPNEPLPQLIKSAGLPAGLGNLLPSNVQKDPAVGRQIASLIDKYADTIVKGITATVTVQYNPAKEMSEKKRRAASTVDKTGFPSLVDLDNASQAKFQPSDSGRPITDRLAALPQDAGRAPAPAHFDWKERARQIEDQIRKRGLRPADFGVMPRNQKVSNEFSWKGYAKMVCTRLQATMDPGLPETCGCPPMEWKGWNHA